MGVTKFTLKNVRCFAGEQSIDIRPITLLVGENSTGKSTVLGCYDTFFRFLGGEGVNFNRDPYQMGGFKNIIHQSGQKNFSLEASVSMGDKLVQCSTLLEERESELVSSEIKYSLLGGSIAFVNTALSAHEEQAGGIGDFGGISYKKTNGENHFVFNFDAKWGPPPFALLDFFAHWVKRSGKSLSSEFKKFWKKCAPHDSFFHREIVESMAPVRSEPKRTYDPLTAVPAPGGDDVPVYMSRIVGSDEWTSLQKELCEFGEQSGMFKDIKIKKPLGEGAGDPFQIEFKIGDSFINIMDIGYGVSQLLPILVRMMQRKDFREPVWPGALRFILQQPEVHLHPQAQAALGSLLVTLAGKDKESNYLIEDLADSESKGLNYLIETHSDYIVDRIRIEIARGNIDPKHVSLAYHEKEKDGNVQIYNIGFDKEGNLVDAPPSYREFFLHESDSLLGFEKE